ncbi:MAG: hypothetical protein GY733_10780 [bacterium]|nr:hypothetical protein [bacterium]
MGQDLAMSADVLVAGAPAGGAVVGIPGTAHVWNLERPLGVAFGETTANSTGTPGVLGATGYPLVDANCLTFEMSDLPAGQFGYVLMSQSQAFVPLFGGSQGNLHLALPIVRFAGEVLLSDPSGQASFAPDLFTLPQSTTFQPGDTWSFQMWYRDVNPGSTSNATNGLAITFATTGDPAAQFPVTLLEEEEEARQLSVAITLSQPSARDVLVPYSTGGTATYNVDWRVEETNPIVIPAGETSFEVTIMVAEDGSQEPDETGVITLQAPTGGVLGTAPEFTLTIVDDD